MDFKNIPSVDLSDFTEGNKETKAAFVKELGQAYEEIGFVAVKNHGLSDALCAELYAQVKGFFTLSKEEKEVTAYHEAGHALVAIRTKGADPVHKITIIPRGRALGVTMQLPMDEKHGYTRNFVEGRLAILMGGRSAEILIFDEMTTGAGNDIEQATQIARKMVTEWGMSDLLGPMTFGKKNEEVFLGREIQSSRDYSEVTARMIDEEISRIVRDSQRLADEILRKDIDVLHHLSKELLKYETLDAKDLEKILKGEKLTRPLNGDLNNLKTRRRQRRNSSKNSIKTVNSSKKISDQNKEKLKNEESERSKKVESK